MYSWYKSGVFDVFDCITVVFIVRKCAHQHTQNTQVIFSQTTTPDIRPSALRSFLAKHLVSAQTRVNRKIDVTTPLRPLLTSFSLIPLCFVVCFVTVDCFF